jgi:hypothetical protein
MSGATWLMLALALQGVLLAAFARQRFYRALGVTAAIGCATILVLWEVTRGGTTRTEAWLVLSSLPLVAIGAYAWRKPLGKAAMGLGVALTVAMLAAFAWAQQASEPVAPTIVFSVLVLIAMVALFLIAGWLAMQSMIERTRRADRDMAQAATGISSDRPR